MVTLLSDCYISSHGKSAVGPVSYHYANDGQFNFSWSEGEFLIRVRHSTRDGEKDVKAGAEGGREELQSDGGRGGIRTPALHLGFVVLLLVRPLLSVLFSLF